MPIAGSLKETPTLLVFDNFESVLPNGNAPMPADDLQKLLDAAATWFMPSNSRSPDPISRLLITTRNPDIPHAAFTPGSSCLHKELEGLAQSDALELAASILEAHSLPRPARASLERLLDFLRGHPLSLQLAIPQLRNYGAEQLVEEYQTILPSIKIGEAKERNESLEVSLKFSLDRLGAEAVSLLSRLWVFEGGAMEHVLLMITEIPEEAWSALKPQLTSTALIRVEDIYGVNVPFIHFHPTLAPYLKAIIDNEKQETSDPIANRKSEIENRYWQIYYQLAKQLYQDDTQHPIEARALALRELPNLKRALKLALAAEALDEAVDFAARINRFLDIFGRWRERDEIAGEVERASKAVTSDQLSRITKREYLLESGRGERLWQQGRAGEAEEVFRALLARLKGDAEYDTRYDQTLILRNIGLSLRAQGRPSQAADFYRRAIALADGLEQTENVKNQLVAYHGELAGALMDMGKYTETRTEYENALSLAIATKNERHQGVTLGQLGTLAMTQGDLDEARVRHLEALGLFQRMGEDQMEAVAWHQLGMVAEEQAERVGAQRAAPYWDEAERCYKESINIKERLGDLAGVAQTCNQLAIVAERAGRPGEAERWYLRAIELGEKIGDKQGLAKRLSNLAGLHLSQSRLDEAEDYARRALAIDETVDAAAAEIWKDYAILAQIAEKRGRMDEAREWRREEQESRLKFEAGSQADTSGAKVREKADQWNDVVAGIIAVCQSDNSDSGLDKFLDEMAGKDDWKNLVAVLRRILSGERGMELFDGLDDVDSAILRRVLKGLLADKDIPLQQTSSQSEEQQGVTLPQLLELVERAAGGDQQLGGQLFGAFQQMARDDNPAMSTLGNVLLRVLIGERNPNLDGLPDEVASAIRGMLGRLRNK